MWVEIYWFPPTWFILLKIYRTFALTCIYCFPILIIHQRMPANSDRLLSLPDSQPGTKPPVKALNKIYIICNKGNIYTLM